HAATTDRVGHAHDPPPGGLLPGGGGPVSPGPRRDPHCLTSGAPAAATSPRPPPIRPVLAHRPGGCEESEFPCNRGSAGTKRKGRCSHAGRSKGTAVRRGSVG